MHHSRHTHEQKEATKNEHRTSSDRRPAVCSTHSRSTQPTPSINSALPNCALPNCHVCEKKHQVFTWVYVFIVKNNRFYFFISLRLLSASLVTLDTPQLTNPICEPNLEGFIKKPNQFLGCAHIGDATFCSVESGPLNLV